MRNRTYGGVRGRKTKVGEKLLRFPPTRFYRLDTSDVSLACPLSCPLSKRNAAASHGKGKTKKVQKNQKKLAKYLVGSKKVATFAPAKQKCRHP